MLRKIEILLFSLIFSFCALHKAQSDNDPIITTLNNPSPGYLLYDWPIDFDFKLLDNYGEFIYGGSLLPGNGIVKLLKNGLFAQQQDNKFYLYNQNYTLVDSIINPTKYEIDFHDIISLSNGRYLLMCIDFPFKDMSKIVEGGKKDAIIYNYIIIETDGKGKIFWTWSSLEHLDIAKMAVPEMLTLEVIDFAHLNSVFEDTNGNILVSIRNYDVIALISRATGELLWQAGGSACKTNQFTFTNDNIDGFSGFSHQHSVSILPNGNILMFDNGNLKPVPYSRAVEYSIDTTTKRITKVWEYRNKPDIFSNFMGSTERLANGNTLIGWSPQKIIEVMPDKTIALEVSFPDEFIFFRVQKVKSGLKYATLNMNDRIEYSFNNSDNNTGVYIKLDSISGFGGMVNLQKHFYPPHRGEFQDSTFSTIYPYRWVLTPDANIETISGKLEIDPGSIPQISDPSMVSIYKRDKEAEGLFKELETDYDSTTNKIFAFFNGFGEFVIGNVRLFPPELLSPPDGGFAGINGKLVWEKAKKAKEYQLQISENSLFNQLVIDTTLENVGSFDYKALLFNQSYYWRLRSINELDSSQWSEPFWFTTHLTTPILIFPIDNSVGFMLSDKLRWNKVDGALSYKIQISSSDNFEEILFVDTTDVKDNYFLASSLENNRLYFWRVMAVNGANSSHWSSVFSFKTRIAIPSLIFPENDAIEKADSLTFIWSKVSGADYYRFELADNASFIPPEYNSLEVNDTSVTLGGLQKDKEYYWHVKSVRTTDSSDWSLTKKFSTISIQDTTHLEIPRIISPIEASVAVPINGSFIWQKVKYAEKYKLALWLDGSSDTLVFENITTNTFEYNNLDYGKDYFIKLQADGSGKKSEWSSAVRFLTELAPTIITYPENNAEDIPLNGDIKWDAVEEASFFHIQIAEDINFDTIVVQEKNIKELVYIFNLKEKTHYYCRIKSYNDSNFSSWSEIITFKTTELTSLIEYFNICDFSIYPNPAENLISINTVGNIRFYNITITDLLARTVLTLDGDRSTTIININELNTGIYLIKIANKVKFFIKK